ncbi:MAG: hypothetical protein U0798_21445 [Gemmataceae bacterium]
MPTDRFAPARALALPTNHSTRTDVRPSATFAGSARECERVSDASLVWTLHLLNSQEVQDKLSGRAAQPRNSPRTPAPTTKRSKNFFLATTARRPTPEQMKKAKKTIAKNEKAKKQAYENLLWALVNGRRFCSTSSESLSLRISATQAGVSRRNSRPGCFADGEAVEKSNPATCSSRPSWVVCINARLTRSGHHHSSLLPLRF